MIQGKHFKKIAGNAINYEDEKLYDTSYENGTVLCGLHITDMILDDMIDMDEIGTEIDPDATWSQCERCKDNNRQSRNEKSAPGYYSHPDDKY